MGDIIIRCLLIAQGRDWRKYQCAVWNLQTAMVIYFFYLVCDAIGTAATPGLLCQPRVIVKMIVEKQIECRLAGET
jgi:hypothetical protein